MLDVLHKISPLVLIPVGMRLVYRYYKITTLNEVGSSACICGLYMYIYIIKPVTTNFLSKLNLMFVVQIA